MRRPPPRPTLILLHCAAAAALAAACDRAPAGLPPIVKGPDASRRASFAIFIGTIGENSTAIISGSTFDPDTVVAMEWRLTPEPPDPRRGRGTIHVQQPGTSVGWTAYIDPVPPRSDYAITFTSTNRRGVRRDTVVRTGIAPSVPIVSIEGAPATLDTVRGATVRLAVALVSRDPLIHLDVIADGSTLLQWTRDDGQPPGWPRHTPLSLALRVTLPATPGRHTLRVVALDRAGRTGESAALAVVLR
jgi:hypothetical protein